MKCDKTKEDVFDYFYNEMSGKEKAEFKKHVAKCGSCRRALKEIETTSRVLQTWKVPEPDVHFVFAQEKSSWFERIKGLIPSFELFRRHAAVTFAGSIAAVFLIFSIANFKASYNADTGTIMVSTSVFGVPEDQFYLELVDKYVNEQMNALFNAFEQRNFEMMDAMFAENENYQREQIYDLMMSLDRDWQFQRQVDLEHVGSSLQTLYDINGEQLDNTIKYFADLFQYAGIREIER